MGEIAEMMLEGILDEQTGEYLGESVGYPRTLVKGHYNTVKTKKWKNKYKNQLTPSERKIASIRKEIAIDIQSGTNVNEARKKANLKYGKGWRERGLWSGGDDNWSEEDLKDFQ